MKDFVAAWTKVMNADRFDLQSAQQKAAKGLSAITKTKRPGISRPFFRPRKITRGFPATAIGHVDMGQLFHE